MTLAPGLGENSGLKDHEFKFEPKDNSKFCQSSFTNLPNQNDPSKRAKDFTKLGGADGNTN